MKVTAILKGSIDVNGQQPIVIRVANKKQRNYYPTGIRVNKSQFDNGRVTNHPHKKRYNDTIKQMILKYQVAEFMPEEIGEKPTPLFHYIQNSISQWETTKKPDTIRQHYSEIRKLKGLTSDNITMQEVTPDFLYKYHNYCVKTLANKENTVWKSMKFLRTVFRKAHNEGVIKSDPFRLYKMPIYRNPERIFLSKDEILRLEKFVLSKDCPDNAKLIGLWFIVCCLTGLRFADCQHFDAKKSIRDNRLIVHTRKTGSTVSLPFDKLKDKKLVDLFKAINFQPLGFTNIHCNRIIKLLAGAVKINEDISWHSSRHAAGMLFASSGISQEVAANMLGHSSTSVTLIYYKLTNARIDQEYRRIWEYLEQ